MQSPYLDESENNTPSPKDWNYYDSQYTGPLIPEEQALLSNQAISGQALGSMFSQPQMLGGLFGGSQRPAWMVWVAVLISIALLGIIGSFGLFAGGGGNQKPPQSSAARHGVSNTRSQRTPAATPGVTPSPGTMPTAAPGATPSPRTMPTAAPGATPSPGTLPTATPKTLPSPQPPPASTPAAPPAPGSSQANQGNQASTLPAVWTNSGRGEADFLEAESVAETFVTRYESLDWRSQSTFNQATFIMTQGARTRFWQQDERTNQAFITNFITSKMSQVAQVQSTQTHLLQAVQSQNTFFVWMSVTYTLFHQQQNMAGFTDTHTIVVLLASMPFGINNVTGGTGWEASSWQDGTATFPAPNPA